MNDFWLVVAQKNIFKELAKIHKIANYSIQNRGCSPILMTLLGVYPRNIYTKFEANPCNGL